MRAHTHDVREETVETKRFHHYGREREIFNRPRFSNDWILTTTTKLR